jgi:hypothetical protein
LDSFDVILLPFQFDLELTVSGRETALGGFYRCYLLQQEGSQCLLDVGVPQNLL